MGITYQENGRLFTLHTLSLIHISYGVQSVNNASRPNWKTQVNDILLKIYSGELTLEEGLARMQKQVDEAKAP